MRFDATDGLIDPFKPPRGAGQRILYLDFDGVLHHENVVWSYKRGPQLISPPQYSLFQHAPLLEELLAPYPDIRIVLSTSWARVYGCDKASTRLPGTLRARLIGATFHSKMFEQGFLTTPRGMQVWSDVLRRKPKDWLALCDDYLHWPKWCLDKYVRTHEHVGISEPLVRAEIGLKLAAMHAN